MKKTNAHPQLAETDLAAQARLTAGVVARGAQTGAKSAADGFNRFVEGTSANPAAGYRDVPIDESKKDFWDSFAEAGAQRQQGQSLMGGRGNSAVGTSAIKKNAGGMGGGRGGGAKKDEWDEW